MTSRQLRFWLGLSLAFHLLAACLSSGFYHADEHFQILEFLNARMGRSPLADLPLEYRQMMRPWLQPFLYEGFARLWLSLGIDRPSLWALSFRIVSSLIGWASLVALAHCLPRWIRSPAWQRRALVMSALLWCLPAFHARHSSENLGGALLFLGVAGLELGAPLFGVGLLFGLGFEMRYQIAIMAIGAMAYWLWKKRPGIALRLDCVRVVSGGLCAVALGSLLDRIGYGQWVFAPWNYFRFNLIQGYAAIEDTSPAWDFFRRAATESWPVLGVALLCLFFAAWIRKPKTLLTASTAPLLLLHAVVGHKELRFLFPLLHAAPALIAQALEPWEPTRTILSRWLWRTASVWNCVGLAATSLVAAWMPSRFYSALEKSPPSEIHFAADHPPFRILGTDLHFYRPERTSLVNYPNWVALEEKFTSLRPGAEIFVFDTHFELPVEAMALRSSCSAVIRAIPQSIEPLLLRFAPEPWLRRVSDWSLYRCRKRG